MLGLEELKEGSFLSCDSVKAGWLASSGQVSTRSFCMNLFIMKSDMEGEIARMYDAVSTKRRVRLTSIARPCLMRGN